MADDIRLAVGFPDHPKTIKLVRRVGEKAVRCLIRLWLWSRVNRPTTGSLAGMDDDDIEIAAGWDGQPGEFVTAVRAVGFLDGAQLHGWLERQEYAAAEEERSDRATLKAYRRWGCTEEEAKAKLAKKRAHRDDPSIEVPQPSPGIAAAGAAAMPGQVPQQDQDGAPAIQQQCSPPVPPLLLPPKDALLDHQPEASQGTIPYEKIVRLLNECAGTRFRAESLDTRRLIKARWSAGFRLAEFEKVIYVKSAQWRSDPKMVGYLRPATLFGSKFEAYLNEQPLADRQSDLTSPAEDARLQERMQRARAAHPWLGRDAR